MQGQYVSAIIHQLDQKRSCSACSIAHRWTEKDSATVLHGLQRLWKQRKRHLYCMFLKLKYPHVSTVKENNDK